MPPFLPSKAAFFWSLCAEWAEEHLPPFDETIVAYLVHGAICLLASGDRAAATGMLASAVSVHRVAFGGGAYWLALRYRRELIYEPLDKEGAMRVWGMLAEMSGDSFQRTG